MSPGKRIRRITLGSASLAVLAIAGCEPLTAESLNGLVIDFTLGVLSALLL